MYNASFEKLVTQITPICKKSEYSEFVSDFLYLAKKKRFINRKNKKDIIKTLKKIVRIDSLNPEKRNINSETNYISENEVEIFVNDELPEEKRRICMYRELLKMVYKDFFDEAYKNRFDYDSFTVEPSKYYFMFGIYAVRMAAANEIAEELVYTLPSRNEFTWKPDEYLQDIYCESNFIFDGIYQKPAICIARIFIKDKEVYENYKEFYVMSLQKLADQMLNIENYKKFFDKWEDMDYYDKNIIVNDLKSLGKIYCYRRKEKGIAFPKFIGFETTLDQDDEIEKIYDECIHFLTYDE